MCTFMLKPGMVSEQRVYLHAEVGDGGEQRVYLHAEAGDGERAACVPSC